MDFVSLVTQGGLLWKAWVACHYERRLKRQDYLNADVKGLCNFIMDNIGSIPLRCLGHLMLGILRLLLRQAGDLETKADEVRTALLFSLSTGPGLPTVPTVSAASVTLRHPLGAVPVLDFGDVPGLDMLMEPELPDLEVEASLEEGRRHVAPLETITLSSGPTAEPIVEIDDFGAPSPEDQRSMAAVGQTALQMVHAATQVQPVQDEPPAPVAALSMQVETHEEVPEGIEPHADMQIVPKPSEADLPPVDFLLGASSPGLSPPRLSQSLLEGDSDALGGALAAEKAADEAEGFAREAEAAADEVSAILQSMKEFSDLPPLDFLLRAAPEVSTSEAAMQMKMLLEPQKEKDVEEMLEDLYDLDVSMEAEGPSDIIEAPEAPEGRELQPQEEGTELQQQEEMQIVPRRKRRRRSIWFDEEHKTAIPLERYDDTSKITRANPCEYGIFLPHQSYHIRFTTAFGDLCPVLCDPLRRAADVGARQRIARIEEARETEAPSPPRVPLELASEEAAGESAVIAAEATVPPSMDPAASAAETEAVVQPLQEAAEEARETEAPSPPRVPLEWASEEVAGESAVIAAAEGEVQASLDLAADSAAETEVVVRPLEEGAEEGTGDPSLAEMPEEGAEQASQDPADMEVRSECLHEGELSPQLSAAVEDPAFSAAEEHSMADPSSAVVPLDVAPTVSEVDASVTQEVEIPPEESSLVPVTLPPPKRQAQEKQGGSVVPVNVIPPQVQVKEEDEHIEVDSNKVSAKQGRELRASLQEDNAMSFFGLCAACCTPEAAACRFVDLLSLHMNGVLSLEQGKPYGDIAITRGVDWEEWCEESKRGIKREARARVSD